MTTSVFTDPVLLTRRILDEGYGPGAWHGADFKAAIADVPVSLAMWRPAAGRHNIAEIAVHHAFYQHSVRGRLLGTNTEAFPFSGEDWFEINDEKAMSWSTIVALVGTLQEQLAAVATDIASGKAKSPKTDAERCDLLLGITCHAVYHAGQVQLIKALNA